MLVATRLSSCRVECGGQRLSLNNRTLIDPEGKIVALHSDSMILVLPDDRRNYESHERFTGRRSRDVIGRPGPSVTAGFQCSRNSARRTFFDRNGQTETARSHRDGHCDAISEW